MKVKEKGLQKLEDFLDEDDKRALQIILSSFYESVKKRYGLEGKDIAVYVQDKQDAENRIPCSIFVRELGVFEAIVRYLHENKGMNFKEIAEILKRSSNNVSVTYKKAIKKYPKPFEINFSVSIPLTIFSKRFTCFESICLYLKEFYTFHEIGKILNRNDRTIWTIYNRALKKRGERR